MDGLRLRGVAPDDGKLGAQAAVDQRGEHAVDAGEELFRPSELAAPIALASASAFLAAASFSSHTSRAFLSCASQRWAAGSMRRLLVEPSAALTMEAEVDRWRERGPAQEKDEKEIQKESTR